MRLDYFLKISRLVKRRTLAKEMCDKNLIQVNEQVAKAGKAVETGDIILISSRSRKLKVQVEQVPERAVSKQEASTLYTIMEDIHEQEDDFQW